MDPTHLVSVAALVTNENRQILLDESPWRGCIIILFPQGALCGHRRFSVSLGP